MNKPRRKGMSLDALLAEGDAAEAAPQAMAEIRQAPIEIREDGLPQSFFVTAADRKRLRHYCVEVEKSLNEIAHEAFKEYFERRGLPPLHFQTANRASGGRKK